MRIWNREDKKIRGLDVARIIYMDTENIQVNTGDSNDKWRTEIFTRRSEPGGCSASYQPHFPPDEPEAQGHQ